MKRVVPATEKMSAHGDGGFIGVAKTCATEPTR